MAKRVDGLIVVGRFFLILSLLSATALGQAEITLYKGATLFDGKGGDAIEDAHLLVQGARILAVGAEIDVPNGATVVDLQGKWVVPGLIDAHIHFMTSGRMYTRPAFFDLTDKVPYEEEVQWIKDNLAGTLRAFTCSGVTSVLSLGGPSLEYNARDLATTMPEAPTVFIGHGVATHAPRFIVERMIPPWDGELTVKSVVSVEDAEAFVQAAVDQGADLIKTAVDSRGSELIKAMMWYWDWQELEQTLVDEASKHGLMVTTHAHALEYAKGMIRIGAASLQHIPADLPVDAEFVQLAKERGVIVAPTLAIRKRTFVELFNKQLDLEPIEQTCSVPGIVESWYEPLPQADDQSTRYRREGEMAAHNSKALYDAGVELAVGTDSGMIGLAAGSSMHLELRDLNRVGIPAGYLIRAATLNSASLAGKDADYGSLEAGKYADFLILDADPSQDIGNLQAIDRVVKHGTVFHQHELLPDST